MDQHLVTRRKTRDYPGQLVWRLQAFISDSGNDVPGLNTCLIRRIVRKHFIHQNAFAVRNTEFLHELGRQRLNPHPKPTPNHFAAGFELLDNTARHIGWNRKADPLCEIDNGRIDPDDLASQIKERPTGISRIDRRIGLNKVFITGQIHVFPADPTDDPQGDGPVQPERIAHGQDPLSDFDRTGIPERRAGQFAVCLDFQKRKICIGILRHDFRNKSRLIGKMDLSLHAITDDVIIGHNIAIFMDDHARPRSRHLETALTRNASG